MPLPTVIFEDDALVAFDKPSGLLVAGFSSGVFTLHRLCAGTTATGGEAFEALQALFGAGKLVGNSYVFFAAYVILQYIVLGTAWNILGGYTGYVDRKSVV